MALFTNREKFLCQKCFNDTFEIVELFKFYKDLKNGGYTKESLGYHLKCSKCGKLIPYELK